MVFRPPCCLAIVIFANRTVTTPGQSAGVYLSTLHSPHPSKRHKLVMFEFLRLDLPFNLKLFCRSTLFTAPKIICWTPVQHTVLFYFFKRLKVELVKFKSRWRSNSVFLKGVVPTSSTLPLISMVSLYNYS